MCSAEPQMSADDDEAFSAFLDECFKAGPENCALANGNATADSVHAAVFNMFDQLKQNPIALPVSLIQYDALIMGSTIDYSSLKNLLFTTMYHPWNFPFVSSPESGVGCSETTPLEVYFVNPMLC
jgi:hypothetical protein